MYMSEFMNIAFNEALKAYKYNEVPIGAVIVKNNKIVSKAYNKKEKNKFVGAHAEILAIEKASKKLNNWRLDDCDIYITLDPCPMCASAIKQARIKNVYSALENTDKKMTSIINDIFLTDNTNASVNFLSNLECEKSKLLLNKFFKNKRK